MAKNEDNSNEIATNNIFHNLISEFKENKSFHIFITGIVMGIFLVGVTAGVFYIFARANASILMGKQLKELDPQIEKKLEFSHNLMRKDLDVLRNRMQDQYSDIRGHQLQNLLMLKHYYQNYFICIGMVTVMGILSAIFLLFISKKGWMNSNAHLLTAFLITSSSGVFFGPIPTLYGYIETSEKLRNNYLAYNELSNYYATYAAIESTLMTFPDRKPIKNAADFINVIDYHVKKMQEIPVFFNANATPKVDEIFKSITGKLNAAPE